MPSAPAGLESSPPRGRARGRESQLPGVVLCVSEPALLVWSVVGEGDSTVCFEVEVRVLLVPISISSSCGGVCVCTRVPFKGPFLSLKLDRLSGQPQEQPQQRHQQAGLAAQSPKEKGHQLSPPSAACFTRRKRASLNTPTRRH